MIRRFFSTTLGQILAIIALSTLVASLMLTLLVGGFYPGTPPVPPWPWPVAYRISGVVHALVAVPPSLRAKLVAASQSAAVQIRLEDPPAICGRITSRTRELQSVLRQDLRKVVLNVTVRACDSPDPARRIQTLVRLDNATIAFRSGTTAIFALGQLEEYLALGFAFIAMSGWAVWRVTRPLRRLSDKAVAFGREITLDPVQEEGPVEIRRVAQAFNFMQDRVTSSIRDRGRMLAAISHDLRTPLTRMRLQLETNQAVPASAKLLREIALMQSMITSVLTYLSGTSRGEAKELIDVGSMLTSLCDDFEERGASVSYDGCEELRLYCRPNAVIRAVTNLIENGVHYGKRVHIEARASGSAIVIEVMDEGPGIPEDRAKDVTEPFVRLDPSRSDHGGSVGLGLSIVKGIVESHGGELSLINCSPNGLVARLSFPDLAITEPLQC